MSDNQQSDGEQTRQREGPRTTPRMPGRLTRRSFLQSSAAAGASALALGGASTAAGQSKVEESCVGEYEVIEVGDGGMWHLMNNKWGMEDSQQCIWLNDDGSYGYDFSAVGDGINYPEVFCGGRPWGSDTGIPELPGRRGDIDEFVLEWDVDINITGGEWDLAEEWWMVDGETGEDPYLTHEIMLVLDWGGGHGHYMEEENVWTDQFGNTIDYWAHYPGGGGTEADFHIFRIRGGASRGKVDMMEIIDFMNERHGTSDELTLTGVEVGNEYWHGAEGEVTYNAMNLVVNGSVYTSGPEGRIGGDGNEGPEEPASPDDQWTNEVTQSSIDLGWSSVDDADEYDVYVDDSYETTTSATSTTITGLSPDTQYTIGLEASNEAGTSDRTQTYVTTEAEADESACEEVGADTETLSDGSTVCDIDGDGWHRDVNGDGSVSNGDVTDFFSNQHVDPWDSRTDLFDFDGDGDVGQGDVVDLFNDVN